MASFTAIDPVAFTKVRAPWGWLGNMSPHPIVHTIQHSQSVWPTAEHLFQAMRLPSNHPAVREMLRNSNPMAAKMAAKKHAADFIITPLSEPDLANMRRVLRLKVSKHPTLAEQLSSTGDKIIIEDVSSRRNKGSALFWGAANDGNNEWTGDNWLGQLWIDLRRELHTGEIA